MSGKKLLFCSAAGIAAMAAAWGLAPAQASADDARLKVSPAVYRIDEGGSRGASVQLARYRGYHGGWGWRGAYRPGWGGGWGGYRGYGWRGYYRPYYARPYYYGGFYGGPGFGYGYPAYAYGYPGYGGGGFYGAGVW